MVTSSYPRFPGDATAPFIQSIAEGIASLGHQVDIVLPHHPDLTPPAHAGIRFLPYRYAPRESWSIWGYAQSLERDVRVRKGVYLLAPLVAQALRSRVAKAVLALPYDVMHVHWVVPNAAFLDGLSRTLRIPLVVSLHGSDVFLAEKMPLARLLAGRAFSSAGAITACSRDLERRAFALGADRGKTRLVPYGVDPAFFSPKKGEAVRDRLGVKRDALLVLGVGRLVEKKGFSFLIEAAAGLRGVHVVLAGDGDLRSPLEVLGGERGTSLTFAGRLERGALAELMGAADIVAVPSVVDQAGNVDGLPNTLLEALAAGRPVVASSVAGIPDVVVDGENGLLVPEKDSSALREALRFLVDPEKRRRLGENGRKTVLENFSWEKAVADFLACYAQAKALDAR
ncbi:MAG TPA: glycosyltransferase [Vicinamibacteria bacterium]|jgi:glycosyltransferase involved in cell wall biosynthesis|nr:glycosyltransferase [Vicinamibacteria bacterium]